MPRYPVLRSFAVVAVLLSSLVGVVTSSTQAAETTRSTTSVAPRLARPDCGDKRLAKPGGGYWRCSFSDDFDGTRLNRRKWNVMLTGKHGYHSGYQACFVDDPSNLQVGGGKLRLTTHEVSPFLCENAWGPDYLALATAASITTGDDFKQTYGRYEFRVKFPASKRSGLHSAVWMYPNKELYGAWPASGEIDIAERFTAYHNRLIPYIHYLRNGTSVYDTNEECFVSGISDRFHKIVLIWTASGMTISYDGKRCARIRTRSDLVANQPFDKPFSLVLTQSLGIGGNTYLPGLTPLPATMTVDYVRVWR